MRPLVAFASIAIALVGSRATATDAVAASAAAQPPLTTSAPDPARVHAPDFALWLGARVGILALAGNFYEYQVVGETDTHLESASQLAKPGLALEADLGVRLVRRYVPYVFLEHGFMRQGALFAGTDVSVSTDFYGLGARVIFGEPDAFGFVTDLALGRRVLATSGTSGNWSLNTFELFRFGLGAEIRMTSSFVLVPMLTVSTGAMSSARGSIAYGPDAVPLKSPLYQNGAEVGAARRYLVAGLQLGGHFDLFGR